MVVTNTNQMDALTWTKASDQFGTIDSDANTAGYTPTGIHVETLGGITYVVSTYGDGDVKLHRYEFNDTTGQPELTLLGEYQGGSAPDDEASGGFGFAYSSPAIELIGDTLVITAGGESDEIYGFTYDTTLPDPTTTAEAFANLDFRGDFLQSQNLVYGGNGQTLEKFTLSNGESYYIQIDAGGNMASYQVAYDEVNDVLTFETNFAPNIAGGFNPDYPYLGARLARQDTLDENSTNLIASGAADTSFTQVGDVIYGYTVGTYGLEVTKWELDSSGNMTGAQVVYTDGTTTKDLYEYGLANGVDYSLVDNYPATSPFDPTAVTLATFASTEAGSETQFLQAISGLSVTADVPDGSIDTIDLQYMRNVGSFEVNGQVYMAVSTWNGSEDGFAVFTVDPLTGLPDQMTGFVESDLGAGIDADDFTGVVASDWSDITIQQVGATGEFVLTFASGPGLFQFEFDPTKSSLQNGQGSLSYLGYDSGGDAGNGYGNDTDSGGSAMTFGGQSEYVLLPDGYVISTDASGLWLSDAGLYAVTTTAPICFVEGTKIMTERGEVAIETLQAGDMVMTKDNDAKPIRWINSQTCDLTKADANDKLRPIRIRAGALGKNRPEVDLYVSQQHRILVKSQIAKRLFGEDEVLIPAKLLLELDGVDIVEDCDEVTYVHFLFDQHEIVYSNGAETESLFTGPEALKAVSKEAREEILSIFPILASLDYPSESARYIPANKACKKLAQRHQQNGKPLYLA